MDAPADLEIAEGYCQYSPHRQATLIEAVGLVTRAIAYCREQKLRRLLVDARGLGGVAIPTLEDRYWMVQDWAQESQGMVVVAMVLREEYIDPKGFGVTAAADAGLTTAAFTSKSAAVEWLLAER